MQKSFSCHESLGLAQIVERCSSPLITELTWVLAVAMLFLMVMITFRAANKPPPTINTSFWVSESKANISK